MLEIFQKAYDFWKEYGFEILLVCSLIFLFFYWLYRRDKQGTYSTSYTYIPEPERKRSPIPRESKGEKRCREVLEKVFSKPFPKVRPDFLRNPVTGGEFNLELDCYNPELKLALEYHGIQHYKYSPFIHRGSKERFYNQKYRDHMTRDLCQKNGIKLIEVPYTVKEAEIEDYIRKELRDLGYSV